MMSGGFKMKLPRRQFLHLAAGAAALRADLVNSLARPGGNTTGISLLSPELDGKRLETLAEAVPGVRKMAALADATVTPQSHLDALQDAAHRRGFDLLVLGVSKIGRASCRERG